MIEMMINLRDIEYMRNAIEMLNAGKIEGGMECPECDDVIEMEDSAHIVYRSGYDTGNAPYTNLGSPAILICCQGYHLLRDDMDAAK